MEKKTAHQIIDETVAYYNEDVNRRSLLDSGYDSPQCRYNGPDNKHCAFARMCNPIEANQEGSAASEVIEDCGEDILLEEYRGQSLGFYDAIQRLHDSERYWDSKGITDLGKEQVALLKANY